MTATTELLERLHRHYIKPGQDLPGGIFLPEVGKNGSWGAASRCDAIYVGFTSTSGRLLVGHELKVSRADWLTELNKPGKADTWADQCHEWWLVTDTPDIVHDGELPDGWGHMVPGKSKTRMKVLVPARRHSDRTPSWNAVRSIMARQDTLRAEAIRRGGIKEREKARAEIDAEVERRVNLALARQGDLATLQTELNTYRKALDGHLIPSSENRPHRARFGGEHTEADLRDLAALLRTHVDLEAATRALVGRYSALDSLRTAFDRLEQSIREASAQITKESDAA